MDAKTKQAAKHTPGPWREDLRWTVRSPRVEQVNILDRDGRRVGAVLADDTEEVENCTILEVVSAEGRANAHLIAAAPDGLTAAREAAAAIFAFRTSGTPDYERLQRAQEALDAFVAKAEGSR